MSVVLYNHREGTTPTKESEVFNMYVAYVERENKMHWIGTFTDKEKAQERANTYKGYVCSFDTAIQMGIYPNN